MDELTAALASSFQVSNIPNNPNAPHPRFSQYKLKNNVPDQHERRRRILEQQKKSRFDFLKHVRKLADDDWEDLENEIEEEKMEVQPVIKPGRRYKNQLMLSEWMVDVPEKLVDEWVMVPCPVGKRTLVVTSRGTTAAYAKNGFCLNKFPSLLPCGNRRYGHGSGDYCILDCLYSDSDRTYYVLDLMCWKGHPVYDSETDFRFYWATTKLQEVENLDKISKINPFRFIALPNFPCDKSTLSQALALPSDQQLDGLLFYHKKAHYTFGVTPLVVWLKPFMMPEMLDVDVPDHLLKQKPADYTNAVNHVEQWKQEEKDKKKRHRRRRKKQEGMEVSSEESTSLEESLTDSTETESQILHSEGS